MLHKIPSLEDLDFDFPMPTRGKTLYIFRWFWRQKENYCLICGQPKIATTPQPLANAPKTKSAT